MTTIQHLVLNVHHTKPDVESVGSVNWLGNRVAVVADGANNIFAAAGKNA